MRCLVKIVARVCAISTSSPVLAATEQAPQAPTYLLRLVLGLALVLATVFVLGWLLKRLGGAMTGRSGPVRVIGSAPVGQRERVVLIEVGGEQLLVGVAPGSVRSLHVLAEEVAVNPATPDSDPDSVEGQSFRGQLQSIMRNATRRQP